MTSPLPAHLAVAIRERIAVLREAWNLDEVSAPSHRWPQDHPVAPGPSGDRPTSRAPRKPGGHDAHVPHPAP